MISCLKNCKVGDIIHIPGASYFCTSDYIDGHHPGSPRGRAGYVLLRNISNQSATYITLKYAGAIKRIVKKSK